MLNNDNDLISIIIKNLFKSKKEVLYGKKLNQDANQMVFLSVFIKDMKRELTET